MAAKTTKLLILRFDPGDFLLRSGEKVAEGRMRCRALSFDNRAEGEVSKLF